MDTKCLTRFRENQGELKTKNTITVAMVTSVARKPIKKSNYGHM